MAHKDWIYELSIQERSNRPLYYLENGKVVFTEDYHIGRGSCCGSKCRHCPFIPKHIKGSKQVK